MLQEVVLKKVVRLKNNMSEKQYTKFEKTTANIERLLKYLIAIELAKCGVGQVEIGKKLGVATGTVNKWVKGVKPIIDKIKERK